MTQSPPDHQLPKSTFGDLLTGLMLPPHHHPQSLLVLADWLEEHDDHRSEVIRLSCHEDADTPAVAVKIHHWLHAHSQSFQDYPWWPFEPTMDQGKLKVQSNPSVLQRWLTQGVYPLLPTIWMLVNRDHHDDLAEIFSTVAKRGDLHLGLSLVENHPNLHALLTQPVNPLRRLHLGSLQLSRDNHAAWMTAMPHLEHLQYSWMHSLSDLHVSAWRQLQHLHRLEIIGCPNLADDAFRAFAELPHLRSLRLNSCHGLTDLGMPGILEIHGLEHLDLSDVRNLTAQGLLNLPRLRALTSLRLGWATEGGVRLLRRISQMTHLRTLSLHHWAGPLPVWFFEELAKWPQLKFVDLCGCPQLSDDAVLALCRSQSLQSLDLANCRGLTDETLRGLESTPTLEWLDTQNCSAMSSRGRQRLRRALPAITLLTARQRR
ncbi:hypothetical protein [Tuwongella immobilis]|uniref:Uncharacterized protein n=1 Tax=Tuwongella immobilis TaxID=692036 RepID=A0A6C2YPV9_9BACT|nr:hypothetical protein [Tuwongella immobilis]VIP02922.1 Putative uncharacterized protein OS=Phytophthora sojae (strain P6497) GN=PHYSODRAFT_322345 PE=4 SV=1: LRR_6: LRR_6 [Tuwongella immobilis]VTS02854.1 Putative uncharacterized protein OS=Phytophthora sojae (strain P6497) GN=PHYSODRAFT_322345 PE=4 SV=1: LRR_6: LRR_6 [Tuwongella immobilis]